MFSKRDIIIFFAGVEFYHSFVHLMFTLSGILPLKIFFIVFTEQVNFLGLIIHALISFMLLVWASKLK